MLKSDRIRRFTRKGWISYVEWKMKLPSDALSQYLKYCVEVIGLAADGVVGAIPPEEIMIYLNEFEAMIEAPPKHFETVDKNQRFTALTKACFIISSWHEEGDLFLMFYENVFRKAAEIRWPGVEILSIYDCVDNIHIIQIEEYHGGSIPTC